MRHPFLLLLLAAPAFAQLGHVWGAKPLAGFCNVTGATNATPIRVTVSDISKCQDRVWNAMTLVYDAVPIADGNKILVNSVKGNLAANVHCEDSTCDHQVYTVSGVNLGTHSFDLTTRTGSNVAGSGTYTSGTGRVHLAEDLTLKSHPIGAFDGAGGTLTGKLLGIYAVGGNPPYNKVMDTAGTYESNYASKWGYDGLIPAGTNGAEYGVMTIASAIKFAITGNTTSRDLVKWSIGDSYDQLWGSPACVESTNYCTAAVSGKMDYGAQYKARPHMQAYSIIRGELTSGQIDDVVGFYLSDLPWTQDGGTNYTGVSLTKAVPAKALSDSDGTIAFGVGKDVTVTGTGTHFTTNGCAVGDFIQAGHIYARDMLITAITDDTHLTVAAAADDAGQTGQNYVCAPRWDSSMYGWLWSMKHYDYSTLAGGNEDLAPVAPASSSNGASGSYGTYGGTADDGWNNHSHTRTLAMWQVGVALCADDIRACLLASRADAYFADATMPFLLRIWTPFPWNGNTYASTRVLGPLLEWELWRKNSFTGASANPFDNTDIISGNLEWWRWTMFTLEIAGSKYRRLIPHADYAFAGPEENGNHISSFFALAIDSASSAAQAFYDFVTTKGWYGIGSGAAYTDGSNAVAWLVGFGPTEYLTWRPDTTSTADTSTSKLFIGNNQTECEARYGAARCNAEDIRRMYVSRTGWSLTDETVMIINGEGQAVRDHPADAAGGFFYINKNGQMLLGTDGTGHFGSYTAKSVASRGYPLVGTATNPALATSTNDMYDASGDGIYGDNYFEVPYYAAYGSNSFLSVELDLRGIYRTGAAVTAMRRRMGHLKGSTQDFIFDHVWWTTGSAKPFKLVQHLRLSGCGTAASSSCISADNTAKTFGSAFDKTGTSLDAALAAKVFGISETFNITTEDGDITDGSYAGGTDYGYSFRLNVQPSSGDVSAGEVVIIYRPTASTSSTLPTITPSTASGWRLFNIAESGSEQILAIQAGGATSATLSFTGAGERLYASGFEAGTYYGKRDGAAISGCQDLVVTSVGQTLECADVGTGAITFDQTPPGGGSGTVGVRLVGPVRGAGRVRVQ